MPSLELLLCCILILLSGYLSASEIALFSLSRFQIRSLKDRLRPASYRKIKRLMQDPGGLLITILVLNEVINVTLSSLITKTVAINSRNYVSIDHWFVNFLAGTLITTPIVLFACEITPKAVGARANQLVAMLTVGPLSAIYDILTPVRVLLTRLVALVARPPARRAIGTRTEAEPPRRDRILKESEFLQMVEEGIKEGAVHPSEFELIRNVFELDDSRVEDIYTPLSQTQTLSEQMTVKNALAAMRSRRFSRIPVTTANRRQVVGILYSKDLLRAKLDPGMQSLPISELTRKPLVAGPTMQLNALFRKFKQHRTHMAIVQRTPGEALGVVTMSDVLESLFDDLLSDESDYSSTPRFIEIPRASKDAGGRTPSARNPAATKEKKE